METAKQNTLQAEISMNNIHAHIETLAEKVLVDGKPDHIIALAKGGFIPARLLAKRLRVERIYSYGINFYDQDDKKREEPFVYQNVDLSSVGHDDSLLIVDDIVDTGFSLKWLHTSLEWRGCTNHKSCAIYIKPQAIVKPDYYVSSIENSVWVTFPWE